jgi:hypothetical protein
VEGTESRPTTASIDARVGRLEAAQAETTRKVDQLDIKMEFLGELMKLKFSAIETGVGAVNGKLDAFIVKIDGMVADGLKQSTELTASPLGRLVDKRLTVLEGKADVADRLIVASSSFGGFVRMYAVPVAALALSLIAMVSK